MTRNPTSRTRQALVDIGKHLVVWRKLQGLTAQQLAERAGISRTTLRHLEHGDGSVGIDVLTNVVMVLGITDRLVDALDPYETDLGRARANQSLPTRVRPKLSPKLSPKSSGVRDQ